MENNNPSVYTTQENIKNRPWYQTWRIIYAFFGLVVIVEIFFSLKTLLAPLPKSSSRSLQPISGAGIALSSDKPIHKVGNIVPVKVRVWTGGHLTSGTDLVLHFDPKILQAFPSAFVRGKIYTDYPLISVDGQNGIIRISGVASTAKQAFGGIGDLGVINFKAKAAGNTDLTIDFKKGQVDESNVMGLTTNEDFLEKVTNLKVTVN